MTDPDFNKEEFAFLSNADLLIQKRIIQEKVFNLLDLTKLEIVEIAAPAFAHLITSAKISRGENYQSLPYLILDYPASFSQEDILACRTMFLWGNFFSTTIHLQGRHLADNRDQLAALIDPLERNNLFISVGDTPWQYHYRRDNYLPLDADSFERAINNKFIKISRKIPLEEYKLLPLRAKAFYEPFLKNLIFKT